MKEAITYYVVSSYIAHLPPFPVIPLRCLLMTGDAIVFLCLMERLKLKHAAHMRGEKKLTKKGLSSLLVVEGMCSNHDDEVGAKSHLRAPIYEFMF